MSDILGKTLKGFREAQQLTLKEAAEILEVDWSMLARIEKGERSVSDTLFGRVSALFGIDERRLRILSLADKVYKEVCEHDFAVDALHLVHEKIAERNI